MNEDYHQPSSYTGDERFIFEASNYLSCVTLGT